MDDKLICELAKRLANELPSDAKLAWRNENKFLKYSDDPVGFCKRYLNEEYPLKIQELMISVRENPITIAQSCNGYGKSYSAASIALWFYKCFDNAQVYTTAAPPEKNLRTILWAQIGDKIRRNLKVFENDMLTTLRLAPKSELISGGDPVSFIVGLPIPQSGTSEIKEAKFAGKHAPYLLLIIDEGDAVPDEVYSAYESWSSGGLCRLLVLFNPRRKSGSAYKKIRDGQANVIQLSAFSHPNVILGKDLYPGAVTRSKTVRRINQWTIPIGPTDEPDSTCFEVPEFLVGEIGTDENGREFSPLMPGFRRILDTRFYYMSLASYPAEGSSQLYSEDLIIKARNRWDLHVAAHGEKPIEGVRPLLGADISDMGDDWNVACLRYGGFVPRLIKWKGMHPAESAVRLADIYKEYNCTICKVDCIGVGADMPILLRREGCKAQGIDVRESPTRKPQGESKAVFKRLRDQLYWSVREWLETDEACLPPDDRLLEQLRIMSYDSDSGEIKVKKKEKVRDEIGTSPDELESLMFTLAENKSPPRVRLI